MSTTVAAVLTFILPVMGFLVSACVPLIIIMLVRRKSQPRGAAPTAAPRRRRRWWYGIIPVTGVSLFVGLMVASIGGAVYPPLVKVAAPLACDGDIHIESTDYSYRPGQHGVSHRMVCVDAATGRHTDVSLPTFAWAALIFAGVAFVPLLVIGIWLVGLLRRALGASRPAPRPLPEMSGARAGDLRHMIDNATTRQAAAGRSPEDRLRELKRLHDSGLIDADDYSHQKSRVLSGL